MLRSSKSKMTRRPRMESLEGRQLMASDLGLASVNYSSPVYGPAEIASATPNLSFEPVTAFSPVASSNALGNSMANYLKANLGRRVGGGECAHIATEALRVAGADFTRTEAKGTTNYVWTSNRIHRFTNGSQLAGKKFQVGDILQFEKAKFSSGGVSKLDHHTQVVASVNSSGQITKVYEQNFNGKRIVQLNNPVNLAKLKGGIVSVYRAVARPNSSGLIEFTILNNTKSNQTYQLQIGSKTSSVKLTNANTEGSYRTSSITFSGNPTIALKIGNSNVRPVNGAAYEIYTLSNGTTGLRRI